MPKNKVEACLMLAHLNIERRHNMWWVSKLLFWLILHHRDFFASIRRGFTSLLVFGILVKPPHVASERVLVSKHLAAKFASHVAGFGAMHIADVTRQRVPRQLLEAERAGLLLSGRSSRTCRARIARSWRNDGIVVFVFDWEVVRVHAWKINRANKIN